MRLTKKLREQIKDAIMADTNFDARYKELKTFYTSLLRNILKDSIPKEFYEATKNLPPEWFPHKSRLPLRAPWSDGVTNGEFDIEPLKIPQSYLSHGIADTHPTVREYSDKWKKLTDEHTEMDSKITTLLKSYTLSEKLVKDFPQFEKYIPKSDESFPVSVDKCDILATMSKAGLKIDSGELQ